MRGIVLAAGRGSRMGQETAHHPKCLTVLAGKSLLAWQLEALTTAGLTEIAIVTGYCAEQLEDKGHPTFHNPRWTETNMVASLREAAPWLQESPCIISYSDIVYHPQIVQQLMAAEGELVITYDVAWKALWQLRLEDILSDAETFRMNEEGRLLEIGRKAQSPAEIEGQYMGLLKITPSGWQRIVSFLQSLAPQDVDRLDMTSLLQRLIEQGMFIQTVPIHGQWCEVDTDWDRQQYEAQLASPVSAWGHDWRSKVYTS